MQKKNTQSGQKVISKARIITSADFIRLRDEREANDFASSQEGRINSGNTTNKNLVKKGKSLFSAVIVMISESGSEASSKDSFIDIDDMDCGGLDFGNLHLDPTNHPTRYNNLTRNSHCFDTSISEPRPPYALGLQKNLDIWCYFSK